MKSINLDNDPKIQAGFKVPDNYFEDFSERLMTKIPEKEVKVISIFRKTKTWVYAAAAILILGISIPVLNQFFAESNDIESYALENYISDQTSLNDNDFAELLTVSDIKKIKIDLKIEDKTIENELSDDENLEEYLIN
jgi:hypothetical protein